MVPGHVADRGRPERGGRPDRPCDRDSSAFKDISYEAEEKGTTVYAVLNGECARLASERGLSDVCYITRDLHVLDYHLGNRSPHGDPRARAL
jgi:ribulose kinase